MENKAPIKSFTQLHAWQYGHSLVLEIYKISKVFPRDELLGLTNQMRRCVVSITSNIAEGFSRRTSKDKSQFYYIAEGSVTELQNQLLIARDVGYLSKDDFKRIADQTVIVHKLINGLIKSLKSHAS